MSGNHALKRARRTSVAGHRNGRESPWPKRFRPRVENYIIWRVLPDRPSAIHDMVNRSFILTSQLARHEPTLSNPHEPDPLATTPVASPVPADTPANCSRDIHPRPAR